MSIIIDSRKIKKGDTFVAIKGENFDGHDYIDKAIKAGATKIIAEHGRYEVETKIVKNTKKYLEKEYKKLFDKITSDIVFFGVTGTNGKTTTTYLLYQMLNRLNVKSSLIGTTGFYLDGEVTPLDNTTPDIPTLYQLVKKSKESDCKAIIMEVSSHALVQNRLVGIELDYGAFTNLTEDHLDYHKTMDEYLKAKLLILDKIKSKFIVNVDDKYAKYFLNDKSITLGRNATDYVIEDIYYEEFTHVKFKCYDEEYDIPIQYDATFNIYNVLTAVALANTYLNRIDDVVDTICYLRLPKGRCETILYNANKIVIDYAHTPDAVNQVLGNYKKIPHKGLYTVIGCTGSREREKRPIITDIACKLSDYVIFTDDDLHYESREDIQKDMTPGLINHDNYEFIYPRKDAIKKALGLLTRGDTLLILGMGHQDVTYVKDEKIPHSDIKTVKDILKI